MFDITATARLWHKAAAENNFFLGLDHTVKHNATVSKNVFVLQPYRAWSCSYRETVIYCIQDKFRPRFIFALFVIWPEGKFNTGLIEL